MRYLSACLLAAGLTALAVATEPAGPSLAYHPRVSARGVALNQSVHCSFSTLPAQLTEVDVAAAVRSSLLLPNVQERWRLVGSPRVTEHEKVKDISVDFDLRPRLPGEWDLPSVPMPWLQGQPVVSFGKVTVENTISLGTDSRPSPAIIDTIAGCAWGASTLQVQDAVKREVVPGKDGLPATVKASNTLTLELVSGRLMSATLLVPKLPLAASRGSFCEQWGDPLIDTLGEMVDKPRLEWLIGWLHISAISDGDATRLCFVHEGVEQRILAEQVRAQVFDVLRSPGQPTAVGSPASDDASGKAAGRRPDAAGTQDAEKEFQRQLKEKKGQNP